MRPGLVIASAAVVWAMYVLLIAAWRRMLAGWGQPLAGLGRRPDLEPVQPRQVSPGKVWAIAGMALMAQRAGVAAWAATASAIVLQVLAIGTGAVVVGLTGDRGAGERRIPGCGWRSGRWRWQCCRHCSADLPAG